LLWGFGPGVASRIQKTLREYEVPVCSSLTSGVTHVESKLPLATFIMGRRARWGPSPTRGSPGSPCWVWTRRGSRPLLREMGRGLVPRGNNLQLVVPSWRDGPTQVLSKFLRGLCAGGTCYQPRTVRWQHGRGGADKGHRAIGAHRGGPPSWSDVSRRTGRLRREL